MAPKIKKKNQTDDFLGAKPRESAATASQLVAAPSSTRIPRPAALDTQDMMVRFPLPPVVHRTCAWKPWGDVCAPRRLRR